MQLCPFGTQVFNFAVGGQPITSSSVRFLANGWGRSGPWLLYMQRTSNMAFRIIVGEKICSPGIGRCQVGIHA